MKLKPFEDDILTDSKFHLARRDSRAYIDMLRYVHQFKIVNKNFLAGHKIEPEHRILMVNWLCEVISKCDLSMDTYFQSVQIMDRYYKCCGEHKITPSADELHLIGVSALFIANKYNDYKNLTTDFIVEHVLHGKFTETAIMNLEERMLREIDYKLGLPTERTFIGIYELLLGDITEIQAESIERQSQINLHSYVLSQCDPALLAAGTMHYILKSSSLMTPLCQLSRYPEGDIKKMTETISRESKMVNEQ